MRATTHCRSGLVRRNLHGEAAFDSFVPTPLNDVEIRYDEAVAWNLADAEFAFGQLTRAFASLCGEDQARVVKRLRREEAEASWRLACGQPSSGPGLLLGQPLLAPADRSEIDDLEEALGYAADPFDGLPLSRRLLSNAHYLMAQGPRYEKRYPGEFRSSPNWIGSPGSTLSTASFVPPAGCDMDEAFSQLEQYIHQRGGAPALVRASLAHYQFEVIHPFIDGNGRIGRMLAQLMLVEESKLAGDFLQLSAALLDRADEYYARIEAVERCGDYEGWLAFFLSALREGAERSLSLI